MITYVLNMILYVISDVCVILCDFTCFLAPAACPGQFKSDPDSVQKLPRSGSYTPRFESNAAAARSRRVTVLFVFEIGWFISPLNISRTLGLHLPSPRSPRDLSVIILMRRSMTVRLWRGGIPLNKLMLEKASVGCVGRQLEHLENNVSVRLSCLTKAAARVSEVPPMYW